MDDIYILLDELNKNIYDTNCLLECLKVLVENCCGSNKVSDILSIIDVCVKYNKETKQKFGSIERIICINAIK